MLMEMLRSLRRTDRTQAVDRISQLAHRPTSHRVVVGVCVSDRRKNQQTGHLTGYIAQRGENRFGPACVHLTGGIELVRDRKVLCACRRPFASAARISVSLDLGRKRTHAPVRHGPLLLGLAWRLFPKRERD